MRRLNEKGVSPVIGVILMVAITVILAAVIASFVFGMGGSVKKQYLVSATVQRINNSAIVITYTGGPDANYVTALTYQLNGQNGDCEAGGLTTTVGSSCTDTDATNPKNDHVVVSATFQDGTQQVILDTIV